jgi:hypothetical protein
MKRGQSVMPKISGVVICVKIYNRGLSTCFDYSRPIFVNFQNPLVCKEKGKNYFQGFSFEQA